MVFLLYVGKEEREEAQEIRNDKRQQNTQSPLRKMEMMRMKFFAVTHNYFLIAIWDSGVIKHFII